MDSPFSGRPVDYLLNRMYASGAADVHLDSQLAGDYDNPARRFLLENRPISNAFSFSAAYTTTAALQAYVWASGSCYKVSTLAGGLVGGILGGACGILKSCQLSLADRACQPFTKTIRDYAIRGKSIGSIITGYAAIVPAIWLGVKVTIVALPVLYVSVPLFAVLGALSGIEFAYRGNRSIGYRVIDKVFEYTLPWKYNLTTEGLLAIQKREMRLPWYPHLEEMSMSDEFLRTHSPLPPSPVICVSPAALDEETAQHFTYHVYNYEELRHAYLNDQNYVYPHNGEPIDWNSVYRLTAQEPQLTRQTSELQGVPVDPGAIFLQIPPGL